VHGASQGDFELPRRTADLVEPGRCRERWRGAEHVLKLERDFLGLFDPGRILRDTQRRQLRPQLVEIAACRRLRSELAQRDDRDRVANTQPFVDGLAVAVVGEPGAPAVGFLEGANVDPVAGVGLRSENRIRAGERGDSLELVGERHRVIVGPDYDATVVERVALVLAVLAFALALLAIVQARARRRDPTDEALARLQTLVAEETASAAEELKSRLARMRADALSSLVEEERKIADERRREFAERERAAGVELAEALSVAARRVDERLRTWGDDLDRAQQSLETDLRRLEQRQKQLIADAEARIETEASELVSTSDEQRASVLRLREELERSAQSAVSEALEELEAHTAERRRVIEEIADRLRRREQALMEQVERGETEAASRIEMSYADIERRQVEHLQRVIAREAERYAEAAGVQFESTMRAAREEAAVRLSRELDRAVEMFVRQADTVFAERLSQTGEAGQQRLEARQRQAQSAFERQQDELAASFAERIAAADAELRRTLGAFVAEAEAERAALAERLAELARRIDEATRLRQV
jgi:hypothetical protein